MDAPTTELPQGAFQSPGTMSYGDELTPEALSVPSGFDDLITSTTSQVLQAASKAASVVGHVGRNGMRDKLSDHMPNTGDLADTSGPLDLEIVSQDDQVQFWLVVGYTIVVFAAIIGNWVLNHIIMKYKRVHTATGLFVVNISVTNMMLALLSSPFTMVSWNTEEDSLGSGARPKVKLCTCSSDCCGQREGELERVSLVWRTF